MSQQRKLSLTAENSVRGVRQQSASGPPTQEFVTVAVLPPRLPEDVAPPTGLGPADAFSWNESLNWQHNERIRPEDEATGAKKWRRKAGVTTRRKKANDTPPFIFRKVPYDVWRKHYAKDKDGRFQGTGTPAEDCLLLPEDVAKWSLEAPQTKGDLYTRGRVALPVYDEEEEAAPQYSETAPEYSDATLAHDSRTLSTGSLDPARRVSTFTADGKTSEQIIQEAKERSEAKKNEKGGWKNTMKRATEYALLGANY